MSPFFGLPSAATRGWLLVAAATLLAGCQSADTLKDGMGGVKDKALEAIGFKKPVLPEVPEAAKPARKMALRVGASESLNVDPAGRSLSLVVRVYKLRSAGAFLNAPYEAFGNVAKEREALGDEMIETREVQLVPGKEQSITERWARDAGYVGVVALFRAPSPQRWRYAFSVAGSEASGIVLGAHACSLSVAVGTPVDVAAAALKATPPPCH
jgi:type VI secretion system protein VasD